MDSINKLVWYPDANHGFAIGKIVDIGQTEFTIEPVAVPCESACNYVLQTPSAASQQLKFSYKQIYPCNQFDAPNQHQLPLERLIETKRVETICDVEDNCALLQLHEAALLDNIRIRFQRDKIYTYVAHILIAVNPYFDIHGLHSPQAIQQYQGKSLGTMAPHVFAIADKAYRDMKAFKNSQSIIISGESGAGKTESQKYVLRYLCLSGSQSGRLEKLILDANPLLEAFGNAKTIRNNNSSRFGKFIEIHYSAKFQVIGGLFFHYLLEKSRICTQSVDERNYHIFYQLCACLPEKQWAQLALGPPDQFHYLSHGCTQYFCSSQDDRKLLDERRKSQAHRANGSIQDQLIDDVKCFQQTDVALTNFGLSEAEKLSLYSIVAAVLHLGNINFTPNDDDDQDDRPTSNAGKDGNLHSAANSSGCRIDTSDGNKSRRALEVVSKLIGLDCDLLEQSLSTRVMSTGRVGHKGTVYMVQLNCQQAQLARDALAKAIYSKLFDYLVTSVVNKSILAHYHKESHANENLTAPGPVGSSSYYIGVLDVAGFEYFQHNSFEQFLINFCNEKLQQFFNQRILKEEQHIYECEGLNIEHIEFIDNKDCIQLFEQKSLGIFDLLDEESRLPKSNAKHFTQSVHQSNAKHFHLAVPRTSKLRLHRELRDDEGFLIKHYAGAVCYETQTFIEKNNDALHASLRNLMLEANNELVRKLFSESTAANRPQSQSPLVNYTNTPSAAATNNKLSFISVGTTFRNQLNELMSKLESTGSHFIRCIKPNSEMIKHKFNGGQILSQLHCSGMNSVLKLMQQGFPSRLSFNELYSQYRAYLPKELQLLDSHLFCRALFRTIGLREKQDYCFGSSKIFFKSTKFYEFDQLIKTRDESEILKLIGEVKKWLIGSRWRKMQYSVLCVIKLKDKILFRREQIIKLQKYFRLMHVKCHYTWRINLIKQLRGINISLSEFKQLLDKKLKQSNEKAVLLEEADLLSKDVREFESALIETLRQAADGRQAEARRQPGPLAEAVSKKLDANNYLDLVRTKRDLLVRSIKDKIAKQNELLELERKMALEQKQREEDEIARRREQQIKQQRTQMELRRRQEEEAVRGANMNVAKMDKLTIGDNNNFADVSNLVEEQEQRDYEIALRLAQENNEKLLLPAGANSTSNKAFGRAPLPPSENLAAAEILPSRFDLTKWKYSDLRDTINTSCDLELLEACKREFHRRLKVYHAWRAMNSTKYSSTSSNQMRAPDSVMNQQQANGSALSLHKRNQRDCQQYPEQRYFRIPFLRSSQGGGGGGGGGEQQQVHRQQQQQQRGWWFAHFDGQWIARQLELHPNREPILLVAGQHDIDMCELSLDETRLTSKRGAEILPEEFEAEWRKHGGGAYVRNGI